MKKYFRGKKLRFGKIVKFISRVIVSQLWFYSYFSFVYVLKDRNYDELIFVEFVVGYVFILQLKIFFFDERIVRFDYFVVLMYFVIQFVWFVVREFYVVVLFEIECGRVRWGDLFVYLEFRFLRVTGKFVSNLSFFRQFSVVLFCRDF